MIICVGKWRRVTRLWQSGGNGVGLGRLSSSTKTSTVLDHSGARRPPEALVKSMSTVSQLGEVLLQAGVIDAYQLHSAQTHSRTWGTPLSRVFVDHGFVTEINLTQTVSAQLNLPIVTMEINTIDPHVLGLVSKDLAKTHRILPIQLASPPGQSAVLTLAMVDPTLQDVLNSLSSQTGYQISVVLMNESQMDSAIFRFYFQTQSNAPHGSIPVQSTPPSAVPAGDNLWAQHATLPQSPPAPVSEEAATARPQGHPVASPSGVFPNTIAPQAFPAQPPSAQPPITHQQANMVAHGDASTPIPPPSVTGSHPVPTGQAFQIQTGVHPQQPQQPLMAAPPNAYVSPTGTFTVPAQGGAPPPAATQYAGAAPPAQYIPPPEPGPISDFEPGPIASLPPTQAASIAVPHQTGAHPQYHPPVQTVSPMPVASMPPVPNTGTFPAQLPPVAQGGVSGQNPDVGFGVGAQPLSHHPQHSSLGHAEPPSWTPAPASPAASPPISQNHPPADHPATIEASTFPDAMSPAASTDKPLAKTVATPNPFAPTGPSSAHAASEQELEAVSGQFDGGSAPSPQEAIRPLSPNISPFEETLPYSAQAPMNLAPSDATQEAQNTRDDFPAFDIDEGLSDEPLSTSDSPPGEHSSPASSTHGNVEHGHPQSNDPHASLSAQEHSHHLVETAAPPLAGQPTIQNQVTPPLSQQPEETHELQAEPPPGDTVDELDIDFDIVSQEGAPISAADRISVPAASHEARGGSPLEQQDQTESAPSGIGPQAQTVSKLTQSALATEVNTGPQPRPLPGRSDHLLAEAADNAFSETDAHEPFTVERFMVPTLHTEEIDIDLQSLVSGEAQTSEVEINVTSVVTSEEAESSLLPGESVSDFGDFMDALENQMRPFLSLNNIADIEHSKAPLGLDSKGHPLIHLMEAFLSKKQEGSVDSQAELRNVVSLRTEGRAQQRLLDSMNALDVEQLKALSRVDDPYVLQEQLYKPSSEPVLTSIEDEDEAQTITHEIEIGTEVPVPTAAEESATDHQNGPEPASQEAQSNTPTEEGQAPTPPANGNTSETLAESWRNAAEGQLIQKKSNTDNLQIPELRLRFQEAIAQPTHHVESEHPEAQFSYQPSQESKLSARQPPWVGYYSLFAPFAQKANVNAERLRTPNTQSEQPSNEQASAKEHHDSSSSEASSQLEQPSASEAPAVETALQDTATLSPDDNTPSGESESDPVAPLVQTQETEPEPHDEAGSNTIQPEASPANAVTPGVRAETEEIEIEPAALQTSEMAPESIVETTEGVTEPEGVQTQEEPEFNQTKEVELESSKNPPPLSSTESALKGYTSDVAQWPAPPEESQPSTVKQTDVDATNVSLEPLATPEEKAPPAEQSPGEVISASVTGMKWADALMDIPESMPTSSGDDDDSSDES